jgi:phage shock protein C
LHGAASLVSVLNYYVWSFTIDANEDNIRRVGRGFDGDTDRVSMRLMRSRRDRWIYGVCGGIARRYGWSSTAVRLVTVLLAIFIPGPNIVVILAYFLLAFLLPEAEDF